MEKQKKTKNIKFLVLMANKLFYPIRSRIMHLKLGNNLSTPTKQQRIRKKEKQSIVSNIPYVRFTLGVWVTFVYNIPE